MSALDTFWQNIIPFRTEIYTFLGLLNSATKDQGSFQTKTEDKHTIKTTQASEEVPTPILLMLASTIMQTPQLPRIHALIGSALFLAPAHLGPGQVPAVPLHPEPSHQSSAPVHCRPSHLPWNPLWDSGNKGDFCRVPVVCGLPGHHPEGHEVHVHRG